MRDSFGDVAIATNDPADVAAVAAVALTTADHEGEALRVTGPEAITLDERVAILGDVLGPRPAVRRLHATRRLTRT